MISDCSRSGEEAMPWAVWTLDGARDGFEWPVPTLPPHLRPSTAPDPETKPSRWHSILPSILAGSLARDNPATSTPGCVGATAPENTHPARTSAGQDQAAGRGLTSLQSPAWFLEAGVGRIILEFPLLALSSKRTGDVPSLVCYNCCLLESPRRPFPRGWAC